MNKVIELRHISKVYSNGKISFAALKGVSCTIEAGEYVALLGASGSGKSTFMQIVGCLSTPTSGKYWLDGQEVSRLSMPQLAKIRGQKIGFIFQNFNLLPHYNIVENVALPLLYQRVSAAQRIKKSQMWLERLGLSAHFKHRPNELSGGQKQRVAIARALITEPELILADEPTGNLDTQSGQNVIDTFEAFSKEGKTILIVTHDHAIAKRTQRIIEISDGRIV